MSAPILAFVDHATVIGDGAVSSEEYFRGLEQSLYVDTCPYCNLPCQTEVDSVDFSGTVGWQRDRCSWCGLCGWWSFSCSQEDLNGVGYNLSAQAVLRRFSVADPDVPTKILLSYLQANPDSIQSLHPKKFEELVAAVYSEALGFKIEYCSYCRPDLGVDIVMLERGSEQPVAVQVKRYKRPIELGLIHQFYGALIDNAKHRGVFVTSGRFRSGAVGAAKRLTATSGVRIDLVDGRRLLDFLRIRPVIQAPMSAESCPYWHSVGYLALRGRTREILGGQF